MTAASAHRFVAVPVDADAEAAFLAAADWLAWHDPSLAPTLCDVIDFAWAATRGPIVDLRSPAGRSELGPVQFVALDPADLVALTEAATWPATRIADHWDTDLDEAHAFLTRLTRIAAALDQHIPRRSPARRAHRHHARSPRPRRRPLRDLPPRRRPLRPHLARRPPRTPHPLPLRHPPPRAHPHPRPRAAGIGRLTPGARARPAPGQPSLRPCSAIRACNARSGLP